MALLFQQTVGFHWRCFLFAVKHYAVNTYGFLKCFENSASGMEWVDKYKIQEIILYLLTEKERLK